MNMPRRYWPCWFPWERNPKKKFDSAPVRCDWYYMNKNNPKSRNIAGVRHLNKEDTERSMRCRLAACTDLSKGEAASILVTPATVNPDNIHGVICDDAYVCCSLSEVEALARRMRARGYRGGQAVILDGITLRLMAPTGRIQISSLHVFTDQPGRYLPEPKD